MTFTDDPQWQLRVGGRWQPPEYCSSSNHDYPVADRKREDVILLVPPGADACRFLLAYRVGSRPYGKAYCFLEQHGARRYFTTFSK